MKEINLLFFNNFKAYEKACNDLGDKLHCNFKEE